MVPFFLEKKEGSGCFEDFGNCCGGNVRRLFFFWMCSRYSTKFGINTELEILCLGGGRFALRRPGLYRM